jgi:hypothetical protein
LTEERNATKVALELNHRAAAAVRALDEAKRKGERAPFSYAEPGQVCAFQIEEALKDTSKPHSRNPVTGVANTLSALRRRGVTAKDGGGAWLQNTWWLSEFGDEVAAELRRLDDLTAEALEAEYERHG